MARTATLSARLLDYAGTRGRARVLLQRLRVGRSISSAPRSRRGDAGRSFLRAGYQGDYIERARCARRRSGRVHARGDPPRGRASSASTSTPGGIRARSRSMSPRCCPELDTLRGGRDALGAHERVRRRQATARSSARPTASYPLLRRRRRLTSATSSSAASTARSTSLGADHHGYVGRLKAAAAMLGYDPERIEVLIYQLVHIVEGRRDEEDLQASRRRRLPARARRQDRRSTRRAGTSSRAVTTSRSTSTSISRAERTQKNPGLLRAVRARARSRASCATPRRRDAGVDVADGARSARSAT